MRILGHKKPKNMQNSNQSCSHVGRNLEQCILCQIVSCRFGPMSENGVLLQLQGRWPSGDRATVALKAYSPQPGMPLRWELRRVKPAAGYPETMPTHKLVKKTKGFVVQLDACMRLGSTSSLRIFAHCHVPQEG